MTTISIALTNASMQRLLELAQEAKVTPEEFLRLMVENWLMSSEDDFARAATYVLKKNEDLYSRLTE